MMHFLESRGKLDTNQAGFRSARQTEDQISRLISRVSDGFQQKKRTVAAMIDFSRAFDTVFLQGLFQKMIKLGLPVCMIRWCRAFLSDRRANVHFGDARSKRRRMRDGLPQGTVLGPLLFLIYINDLIKDLPAGVEISLFADDICLWVQDQSIDLASALLEKAIHVVERFATEWKLTISMAKTTLTLFSLNTHEANVAPIVKYLNGETVKFEKEPCFLGVTFDRTLSFRAHEANIAKRMKSRLSTMRALSGTTWGCQADTLRMLYKCYVFSICEYAAGSWFFTGSATKGADVSRPSVEVVNNDAGRFISGCPKATPVDKMLIEAKLQPVHVRASELAAHSYERHLRLPADHPTRLATEAHVPPRASSRRVWKTKGKEVSVRNKLSSYERQPLTMFSPFEPWRDMRVNATFNTSLDHDCKRSDDIADRLAASNSTFERLKRQNPTAAICFSDGSVQNSVDRGGAGVFIQFPDGKEVSHAFPTGNISSSFKSELAAINQTLDLVRDSNSSCDVIILTDSLSSIAKLKSGPHKQSEALPIRIWSSLVEMFPLAGNRRCIFQFIPGHSDFPGNDAADALAKAGAAMPQTSTSVDLATAKRRISTLERASWLNSRTRTPFAMPPSKPPSFPLKRSEERFLSQLRVDCCPKLRSYLHMIGNFDTAICRFCGLDDETAGHIVLHCPALQNRRNNIIDPGSNPFDHSRSRELLQFCRAIGLFSEACQ